MNGYEFIGKKLNMSFEDIDKVLYGFVQVKEDDKQIMSEQCVKALLDATSFDENKNNMVKLSSIVLIYDNKCIVIRTNEDGILSCYEETTGDNIYTSDYWDVVTLKQKLFNK